MYQSPLLEAHQRVLQRLAELKRAYEAKLAPTHIDMVDTIALQDTHTHTHTHTYCTVVKRCSML